MVVKEKLDKVSIHSTGIFLASYYILGTAPGVRNIIMNKIMLSFEVFELVKRDQHDKLTSKVQRWGDAQDTVEIKMILCVKEIGSDNSARTQGISGSLPGQRQGERGVGRKCSGLPLWTCKNKGGKNNIVRWEQKTGTTGNPTFWEATCAPGGDYTAEGDEVQVTRSPW